MDFFYVHSFSNILGLLTKRCIASFMLISILFSCVPAYEPNPSIEDRNLKREKIIENHLKTQLSNTVYQSLAFGQLTVYKPESFKKLDSLYALKDDYIERNDLRGLQTSKIDELIPAYRAEAAQDIDKLTYELNHIYRTNKKDSFTVSNTYFLLNNNDSILSQDEIYNYTLPNKYKAVLIDYLYEYHFLTDQNYNISYQEERFLEYFKQQAELVAGTADHQPMMFHIMSLMQLAKRVSSVDYRLLVKYKSIEKLKLYGTNIVIEEFGELSALEDANQNISGYEYVIIWKDKNLASNQKTVFYYSPNLMLEGVRTTDI